MTKQEANSKVVKLFNKWRKDFCDPLQSPTNEYYKSVEEFKKECLSTHNIVGLYECLTDKNALKMASICSSIRFAQPWHMLMYLQKTTKTY